MTATLVELDELYGAVEGERGRALELAAFLERLPEEREAAAREADEAGRRLERARASLGEAEEALRAAEDSGKEELRADARRAVVRARDRLTAAGRLDGEARARVEELEAAAAAAARESDELVERAGALAGALRERPRLAAEAGAAPGPGLTGVTAWGTRARAALLVARSQLSSERDALIRQANELGALVLGEQFTAATPGSVAARLERELGRRPD